MLFFLIIACNKSDLRELQVIPNDALRTCFNVKRRDKSSISKMHKKATLLSLEQRRSFQLLYLMDLHKNDVNNLRMPVRLTPGAARAQFPVEKYNVCKYKNSPFYKGAELWKLLPRDIESCDSIYQFKILLKTRYKDYVDTTACTI